MPKACVDRLIKQGKSAAQAHKLCYPGQKAGTSSKSEQDKVGTDRAKSANVRMKKKLGKNVLKKVGSRKMGPGPEESPTLRDRATKSKKWKKYKKKYGA